MTSITIKKQTIITLGLASLGLTGPALAAPTIKEPQAALEEIIVTATRRAENLQNVPLSISAFSAADIAALHVPALEDLSLHTSNMWMPASTEAGQSFITMRGLNGGITRSSGRAVGVYVDGVFVNADTAMNIALADAARVEVLKGPQGTLFGRDTLGGAINITTQRPSPDPQGKMQIDLGNYGLVQGIASASTPLVRDILSLRVSGQKRLRGGYIQNSVTGRKAGAENHAALGAQLYFTPNDRFDAHLVARAQTRDDRPNTMGEAVTNIGSDTLPYTIALDQDEFQRQRSQSVSLNTRYRFAGGHTLRWISGWSHVRDFYIQDGDRLPDAITVAQFDGGSAEISQEIRLTSPKSDRFDYLIGGYALRARRDFNPTFPLMGSAFLERVLGIPAAFHPADTLDGQAVRTKTRSLAAFAHGNWHLGPKLTAFGGLRATSDKKRVKYNSFGEVFTVFGLPPLSAQSKVKSTPLSWVVGGRYQIRETIMSYASISRGYRSAAIKDDFVSAADLAVGRGFFTRPEFLTNYEVGIKATWLDQRLRTNMAAFYMDYTDIQVAVSQEPFLFLRRLTNAAKAHISGFEADMAAQITNDLKLTASAGYVRTRYDLFLPRPNLDLSGQSFGTAPVWTFSFATDYRRSLSGGMTVSAHLDYTDRTAPSVTPPDALAFVGDHALFNGSFGLDMTQGNWRALLWVKNITNVKKPIATKLWGAGLGPLIENETVRYQPPRMFGLSLTRTFGR